MANEEEKIILQADLYDNLLTEEAGDYTARLRISGSLRNSNLAQRILDRGSEYRKDTIENILNMGDQEKVKALAEGKSVVDGVGQTMIQIKGNFDGESAPFDPAKHSLIISYTPGKALRKAMQRIEIQTNKATTGPVINSITNPMTGEVNATILPNLPLIIAGANLKVATAEKNTKEATAGLFFISEDGTTEKPALLIVHNTTSELTVVAPDLNAGNYYVEIRTQSAAGSKLVKNMRTFRYPILLTVGSTEDDRPVIENDDRPEIE